MAHLQVRAPCPVIYEDMVLTVASVVHTIAINRKDIVDHASTGDYGPSFDCKLGSLSDDTLYTYIYSYN